MFVLNDGKLVAMKRKEFEKERDFQSLLEHHPALLSGALIDPEKRQTLAARGARDDDCE